MRYEEDANIGNSIESSIVFASIFEQGYAFETLQSAYVMVNDHVDQCRYYAISYEDAHPKTWGRVGFLPFQSLKYDEGWSCQVGPAPRFLRNASTDCSMTENRIKSNPI